MRDSSWVAIAIVFFVLFVAVVDYRALGVIDFYDDGTSVVQRSGLNLVSGTGISVTSADDPTNNRVGLTVNTTARTGTATVSSNATSTSVTHDLGSALARVLLSPTTDTQALRWWVSATSSSAFTIEFNSTSTVDISFDWRVQGEEE